MATNKGIISNLGNRKEAVKWGTKGSMNRTLGNNEIQTKKKYINRT